MPEGIIIKYSPDSKGGLIESGKQKYPFRINDCVDLVQLNNYDGLRVSFEIVKNRDGKLAAKKVKFLLYLPLDTAKIIDPKQIDNYSLKLNKYPRFEFERKGNYSGHHKQKQDQKLLFKFYVTDKRGIVKYSSKLDYENKLISSISKRQQSYIKDSYFQSISLIFKTDWRLIVGLGCESVYETSILLHHIYGIPFIPGTAIKGAMRSYIIAEIHDGSEVDALRDKGFRTLFGSEDIKGKLVFFDAFPSNPPTIRTDVMTPHYSEYYSSNDKMPADYYDPTIIPFLTVENTSFITTIAIQPENNQVIKRDEGSMVADFYVGSKPLEIAVEHLPIVFKSHGIGAKSAVGYGYFEEVMKQ